jgi:DNA-nicking Smr family endonuclease
MSRDGNGRRALTQDERVLWTTVTKSIEPLRETPLVAPEDDAGAELPKAKSRPAAKPATIAARQPVPPMPAAPPLTPLGRRKRGRVARGKEAIDGRLDLHGLTQSEAHAALLRFLRDASARQARLVLVITGKGLRGDGERGVLRRQLPQWLALPEFRALVIGFEPAHIAHGGEGAWYISVRRQKA